VGNEKSELQPIKAGVPQGSVLGPTLYVLYTSDLRTTTNTTLGTFADDTVILSVNDDSRRAASDLQHHLNALQTWFEKWRIRINENKSCSVTFTIGKSSTPNLTIKFHLKQNQISRDDYRQQINMEAAYSQETKTSQHHNQTIKLARFNSVALDGNPEPDLVQATGCKQPTLKLNWLLGRKSNLAFENKLLI
jgi:hypothetical protein